MELKTIYCAAVLLLMGLVPGHAHTGDHSEVISESGISHFLFDHGILAWFVLAALTLIIYPIVRKR